MCHLILFLPVVSLPIFWLVPLQYALPVYGSIFLLSLILYWLLMRAMRRPVVDGFHSLVGTRAKVVATPKLNTSGRYLVRARGELWTADSGRALKAGDEVNIVAVKGISVVVEPVSANQE